MSSNVIEKKKKMNPAISREKNKKENEHNVIII